MKKIFLAVMIVLTAIHTIDITAQTKSASPLESMQLLKQSSDNSNLSDQAQKEIFPIGNVIDANVYLVGPSDILTIQRLPLDMVPQKIIVSNECSIVLSNFGEIIIKGLTLQQVRDTLTFLSNHRKEGSKVTVSLIQARKVFVTIRGNVISPGTYTLPASYSVSTAIKFANQSQVTSGMNIDEQSASTRLQEYRKDRERIFSETGMSETSSFANRNIRIIRGNGTATIGDIERAIATKDATYDPYISEGDEIIVPFEENEYSSISIAGEVIRPISVVYKKGDMASHLLKMGFGFTDNADLGNINYYCAENVGEVRLEIDTAGNLLNNDFELSPSSVIIVGTRQVQKKQRIAIVSVKGEVNKPNIYLIEPGKTLLTDIIEMAGGFTDLAYLPLATIGRRDNTQNDRIPLRRKYSEYFQHSNMTQQDTMRFNMEMDMKKPMVSCDFVTLFKDTLSKYNVLLQDGDVIQIPQKPNKVNVFGQVNKPGFIDFTENQTMKWYIQRAGGYATNAAPERTRIIRGSNRVWVDGFQDSVFVNDGDEIFVSSPRDVPPEMELQKWAAYSGIAGVVLSLLGLVWSIYRESRQ